MDTTLKWMGGMESSANEATNNNNKMIAHKARKSKRLKSRSPRLLSLSSPINAAKILQDIYLFIMPNRRRHDQTNPKLVNEIRNERSQCPSVVISEQTKLAFVRSLDRSFSTMMETKRETHTHTCAKKNNTTKEEE